MALIECPECKKQVSDTAKTCPHCGYKLNAEQVRHRNKIISWTFVSLLLLVLGIGLFIYISSERAKEKQAQEAFYEYLHESSMPGSYQDARHAIVGTHPNWELIDNSASASIFINFKLNEDEKMVCLLRIPKFIEIGTDILRVKISNIEAMESELSRIAMCLK